jgi:hypothetical protein
LFLLRRAGFLTAEETLTQTPSLDQALAIQITQEQGGFPWLWIRPVPIWKRRARLLLTTCGSFSSIAQCSSKNVGVC